MDNFIEVTRNTDYDIEEHIEGDNIRFSIAMGRHWPPEEQTFALNEGNEEILKKIGEKDTLLRFAFLFAKKAHKGQLDRGGHDYFLHLLAVEQRVKSPKAKVVAILHDTVEDTGLSLERFGEIFPWWAYDSIDAISRRKRKNGTKEDDNSYFLRVLENPIAVEVKIADMINNLDYSRISSGLPNVDEGDRIGRYGKFLPLLVQKYWDNKKDERNN